MVNTSQSTCSQLVCSLTLLSLIVLLCSIGVYAQPQPVAETKAKSPEELEADKLNSEAVNLFRERKYQEALPKAQRALALREKSLGSEAPATMTAMANLAAVYSFTDKRKEAADTYQRLLKTQEKVFGSDDPKLCDTLSKLGWERVANGSGSAAEPIFKRHLQIREKAFGPEHLQTLPGLKDLAQYYQSIGYIDQAISLYRRIILIQDKHSGEIIEAVKAEQLVKYAVLLRLKNKTAEADDMEARARNIYAARKHTAPPVTTPGGVLQGTAIMKVQPEYPYDAKRARVQGTVQVSVVIDEAGIVLTATAIEGPNELRKVSEEAAKKWRFKPTELEGKPIKVQGILTFNFTLQ